ncbi:MAG: allophanate hydrolase subunit 1 [Nocardioides sp.]
MSTGPELRLIGLHAVLVEVGDARAALSLSSHVRASGLAVVDVVPAATTVLLDGVDPALVPAAIATWDAEQPVREGPLVELPTTYDGADLEAVAHHWDTDTDGVIARHAATTFVAVFSGFAPGFAYLAGLGADLAVPRLGTPRSRVPAGSVALAGTWCGVYPTASPGGWQLIGRTDAALWDVDRSPPALLAPGTRVRFVAR